MCLTLPGRKLYLQPLLVTKKFRNRGNKPGAITAFYKLESEKLGKVLEITNSKGNTMVNYCLYLCIHTCIYYVGMYALMFLTLVHTN